MLWNLTFPNFPCSGHVVPEAQLGGPITLVHNGNKIVVDAKKWTIEWLVDDKMKARCKQEWESTEHPLKVKRGALFCYARDIQVSISLS